MAQSVSLFESDIYAPGFRGKTNIPTGFRGMPYIPGGVGTFYGPPHTKYRDYQGILSVSARLFFPTAPNFRHFCKNPRKNNRELKFIEQEKNDTILVVSSNALYTILRQQNQVALDESNTKKISVLFLL